MPTNIEVLKRSYGTQRWIGKLFEEHHHSTIIYRFKFIL